MKKKKSKSKKESTSKKLRKELELKLTVAFNEIVSQFGKAKKTDKTIEKLAKQLSKKVSIDSKDNSVAPIIKDEENSISLVEVPAVATVKKPVTKAKKTVKA